MKLKVFTVYDSKIGAYMTPFFARAVGEAMRNWESACNDPESMMCKHPADYTLFETAEFDDSTGVITPLQTLHSLGLATTAKRPPSPDSQEPLPFPRSPRATQ